MSTSANEFQGLTLAIGDGGGTEVFTAIGEITNLSGPNVTVEPVDVSDADSTWRVFSPGLKDPGEVTFDLWYRPDNTQQTQFRTDFAAGTRRNFQLTYTDSGATVCSFAALITSISPTGSVGGYLTCSVGLKLSGTPTWA